VVEFDLPTTTVSSDFRAVVDVEACIGCGECVEQCQFKALALPEDICKVDESRCVGCGQCVTVCPSDALYLERRQKDEVPRPPADFNEWVAKRAEERGIRLEKIL
jgi:heterodisulfide reductase subunit A-like polyferredoxin